MLNLRKRGCTFRKNTLHVLSLDRVVQGDPAMVAFISLIIGALLDLLRPDGQSTSILTIGPSLTDISKANRYRGTDI